MLAALCDLYSGYGTLQCYRDLGTSSCPGSNNGYCYPNHVWTGEGGQYSLNSGSFGVTGGGQAYAFTVRCVCWIWVYYFSLSPGGEINTLQTGSVTSAPVTAPCGVIVVRAVARAPLKAVTVSR